MTVILPPGWETGVEPTGKVYYHHIESGRTQWDPPVFPSAPPVGYADEKSGHDNAGLPAAIPVTTARIEEVIVQQPQRRGPGPPHGAPEGGEWVQEKHCGLITWLIGIFICWFVCCCPCDDRTVYIVNGVRYNIYGAVVHKGCCVCCGC